MSEAYGVGAWVGLRPVGTVYGYGYGYGYGLGVWVWLRCMA